MNYDLDNEVDEELAVYYSMMIKHCQHERALEEAKNPPQLQNGQTPFRIEDDELMQFYLMQLAREQINHLDRKSTRLNSSH